MQFGTYVKWLNMKINTSVFNYKTLIIMIADVQNFILSLTFLGAVLILLEKLSMG